MEEFQEDFLKEFLELSLEEFWDICLEEFLKKSHEMLQIPCGRG